MDCWRTSKRAPRTECECKNWQTSKGLHTLYVHLTYGVRMDSSLFPSQVSSSSFLVDHFNFRPADIWPLEGECRRLFVFSHLRVSVLSTRAHVTNPNKTNLLVWSLQKQIKTKQSKQWFALHITYSQSIHLYLYL